MSAYLALFSHSPLVGYVDPAPEVLAEVDGMIASARNVLPRSTLQLIVLLGPDHTTAFSTTSCRRFVLAWR